MTLNRLSYLALGVLSCVITFTILSFSSNRDSQCVVHFTGRSVTISGCEFTQNFMEYAKHLDVLRV
ncbi:triple gene block 3 [Red clover vein mosaic virus]|uniref:Movement protein TGBp3 n=1 Tax=Red clover vein mosaic virus TaxID=590403 RepID=C0L9F1_9VIRU|nr:triple gene block 3 [Red clover vein mosaic virus]ACN58191.1 triple gene block 3 [Red clover vein mosaic virus]